MELYDKFEIKVFILFLLKNIKEPLEFSTVNDIVIQDGFVGYFDFAVCFAELLEVGQITELKGKVPKYVISDDGILAVSEYENSIYSAIREKALRSAMRLLAFNRDGSRITARLEEDGTGYLLTCEIRNNERVVFSTRVHLTDPDYAERMKANFEERAEIIYKGSLALLSGDMNFIFDE